MALASLVENQVADKGGTFVSEFAVFVGIFLTTSFLHVLVGFRSLLLPVEA